MSDYEVSRSIGQCCVSGRVFSEGEEFYTVVLEGPDGLERKDYALDAWEGPPEGTLCHFKTRLPKKDEPKKTFVDDEMLIHFFLRLADTEEGLKIRFRFVLSLILMRKRLLKYEKTLREGDRELWQLRLMRDKSEHRVINPSLNESEIESLSEELSAILHGQVTEDVEVETSSDSIADTPEPQP